MGSLCDSRGSGTAFADHGRWGRSGYAVSAVQSGLAVGWSLGGGERYVRGWSAKKGYEVRLGVVSRVVADRVGLEVEGS